MNAIPAQTTDIRAELKTLRAELIDAYDRLVNTKTDGGAKEIKRQIDSILSDTQKYCRKLRNCERRCRNENHQDADVRRIYEASA